ncbi:MAG: NusG domain II-containing protein [Eubacteriales bacterium]|nr:NusG domain II-containing protein [Eubacteriales bacterium]
MKKQDYILIGVLLFVGIALLAGYRIFYHTPGDQVEITIDGETYKTLPLDKDTTIEIPAEDGGSNTLTIQDGYADMTQANCPDKLCIKQKKISHAGETLVCLPHKVVVKVLSADPDKDDAPDSVAY